MQISAMKIADRHVSIIKLLRSDEAKERLEGIRQTNILWEELGNAAMSGRITEDERKEALIDFDLSPERYRKIVQLLSDTCPSVRLEATKHCVKWNRPPRQELLQLIQNDSDTGIRVGVAKEFMRHLSLMYGEEKVKWLDRWPLKIPRIEFPSCLAEALALHAQSDVEAKAWAFLLGRREYIFSVLWKMFRYKEMSSVCSCSGSYSRYCCVAVFVGLVMNWKMLNWLHRCAARLVLGKVAMMSELYRSDIKWCKGEIIKNLGPATYFANYKDNT